MMRINLIGENSRKEIKLRRAYKSLKGVLYFLAILSLFASLFFYCVAFVLEENYQNITNQESSFSDNTKNYAAKTRELNKSFGEIAAIQGGFTPWSCLANNIFNAVPEKILLNNLSVSKEKNSFMISGAAKSRDGLLELKANLEAMAEVESVDLPFEDLLKKEDVEFQLTGKLK